MTLSLRHTAVSDTGLMRADNQDSGYAGTHLVAVADGVSGNVHGEIASAITIEALRTLDQPVPADAAPDALRGAVQAADRMLHDRSEADPSLFGMSTTLTALLCTEHEVHVAHVGDSRAYLLRDGNFVQMTKDHSLVQALVDDGQLTPAEAAVHPQRSVILRAVNGRGDVEVDVTTHQPRTGDRWLLCSDGLSDYVAVQAIHDTLASGDALPEVAGRLVDLANGAGGPDNITCVIADVVETDTPAGDPPQLVGAVLSQPAAPAADDEPTGQLPTGWWQSLLSRLGRGQARVTRALVPALAPVRIGKTVLEPRR